MKNVYIYSLKDPFSNKIRYIGKTTNIKRRLSGHISEAKKFKGKRYVLNWISSLLKNNRLPILEIIEILSEDTWQSREIYWISYYRNIISNLCNNCKGGLGGSGIKNYSDEELQKRKQIMINTMSIFSEEDKIIIWNLIKESKSLEFIQNIYPKCNTQMYSGVKNGRQWNHITKLSKNIPRIQKRKGYTFNRGLYIIKNKDKKVIFSSKIEQEVIIRFRNG